jgi:hypothetical protein
MNGTKWQHSVWLVETNEWYKMTTFCVISWDECSQSIWMHFPSQADRQTDRQTDRNWPDSRPPSGDSRTAPTHTAPHCPLSAGCQNNFDGSGPAQKQYNSTVCYRLEWALSHTHTHTRTCPKAWTFSVGMNMSGYTFSRYHLNGLHFSCVLRFRRSDRSPMSRSWKEKKKQKRMPFSLFFRGGVKMLLASIRERPHVWVGKFHEKPQLEGSLTDTTVPPCYHFMISLTDTLYHHVPISW